MTLNEFIKKFAEEFDETPMSDFTADTKYREFPLRTFNYFND